MQENNPNAFRIIKSPSGYVVLWLKGKWMLLNVKCRYYTAVVSVRCTKCSFEVAWKDVELDKRLDGNVSDNIITLSQAEIRVAAGIHPHEDIRWRTRLVQKCHLAAKNVEEALYGCPFCIEEGKTIDVYDATVFFTVPQFLKHLEKHQNRVRPPVKIKCVSDEESIASGDFDIRFLDKSDHVPRAPYGPEVAVKLASRPTAIALHTHRTRGGQYTRKDPDGGDLLYFAKGATIMGIVSIRTFHLCCHITFY